MSVDGARDLENKLDKLAQITIRKQVGEAIAYVRSVAVRRCPVNDGELRQSIFISVKNESDVVQGICFTNKDYAPYVEFGTGPKGQAQHTGIYPNANPVYTQSPWWIHESQVNKETAEKYGWFSIDTPQGRFYQCTGQPAQPFMYPALKDSEDKILKDMRASFEVELKEKTK